MGAYRLKHSFTAGEISPKLNARHDFKRLKNGCKKLYNMICETQGSATRRPGTQFIHDLNSLGLDTTNPLVREIPFVFNENQAYSMIFFMHTDGTPRIVFGTGSGLVVFDDPPITECPTGTAQSYTAGEVVTLTLLADWDIENFDWAQSADEMYIAQSGLRPYTIRRHSHTCWELVTTSFTDEPSDWSDTNGWPERVTFHQQRLVFGANTLKRQTIWLTQAGDFDSFTVNSPIEDSDGITFTLDSGTQNKIQWVTSNKSLHVGTFANEWTVSGNTQAALTPSNVLSQRQTNNGSESVKPTMIGLTTLFLEYHGRVINEFVYDYTYDSFKTSDLTVLAPHLVTNYSITDWSYQQTPHSILWSVREDGNLLGLTYQRQHEVVGWHEHETQGAFKAIASIPGNSREDEVWFVVKRVIDGSDKYYVEKLGSWDEVTEAEWGRFLDSHLVYEGTATDTITGLYHLEGEEVYVLADGTVHPPVTVSSNSITLNNEYTHVVVGLYMESEVRPYLSDLPTRDGTAVSRTQRITQVTVDLYKSLGMTLGRVDSEDGEHAEEVPFRTPLNLTGQQVPLFTGLKKLAFPTGFDQEPVYFIRQTQPLPLTVRGVVDSIEVNE